MELCPFDPTAPNALADTYTGHLFLLSDTSTASMHQGIESMQQGLTDSNKEPQQILTAASAHSGLDVLQRELSYRRLLACLE